MESEKTSPGGGSGIVWTRVRAAGTIRPAGRTGQIGILLHEQAPANLHSIVLDDGVETATEIVEIDAGDARRRRHSVGRNVGGQPAR